MKNTLNKFKESGLFLMAIMLLCTLFGVVDGSAMTAEAATPAGGGAVETGAMVTATETKANSPNLILDTIDEKVTKIRPYDVVLDTISRHADFKTSDNQVVRHYAIDTIPLTATLTTAISAGSSQAAIVTSDNNIFASEQVILVNGVSGYKDDGVTVDPDHELQLYVVGKDTGGNPLVTAINGTGATKDGIPNIATDTVLTRMGRAGAETQIQTDAYSGIPTDFIQYLQKFMAQVEMSDIFQRADKEVEWEFTDGEEEAVFDMKRVQNVSYWKSRRALIKKRNAHTQKAEDIYLTEGIWSQAGTDFSFGGNPVDVKNMVTLMKTAFTGNASGKSKLLIAGSDVIEAFEQVEYNRTVNVGQKKQAYGLEFDSIISKFGTLMVVHDQSLDDMGMADKFFVLDPNFLRKWTMGWRVNQFDFRKSGQSDADGRGLMEICGLVLKNPNAHVRGSLI
jgi:hypothetical protein